jgi:predicted negative regulator of RcsB-dependent stress response
MTKHRHPSSRRRQEEKKEAEDIFVEKVVELSSWAKKNSQALGIAAVAVILIFVSVVYIRNVRANRIQQAVAQLEQVQQAVALGDREEAEASLVQYLATFDGTPYALEARLVLGQLYLEDGDPDAAMETLAPAVREMDSHPVGMQAAFLLAGAYEDAGRKDEAERMLLRIANTSDMSFQIQEALSGAARIRSDEGDYAGAVDLYEELLDSLDENDASRDYWMMKLEEAKAHLFRG